MAFDVVSFVELATTISVKYANVLRAHVDIIPPVLYQTLLLASIKTNRFLSIGILLSSWPLEEVCLANCVEFTPEHAAMMAHCFQERCNKLRLIDLSSCNTGHCNVNNYNNDDNNDDCDNIIYYNINKIIIIIIIITNFYKVIISIIPVY